MQRMTADSTNAVDDLGQDFRSKIEAHKTEVVQSLTSFRHDTREGQKRLSEE